MLTNLMRASYHRKSALESRLAKSKREREARCDPRLSIEERRSTDEHYLKLVNGAAEALQSPAKTNLPAANIRTAAR
jgi:hypothetical protein